MTGKSTLNEPNMFLCHFLRKKDSKSRRKSRTKGNEKLVPRPNPCVRTDGRTYVRTYVTSKFYRLHGLPIIWLWMLRTHAPSARAGAPLLGMQSTLGVKKWLPQPPPQALRIFFPPIFLCQRDVWVRGGDSSTITVCRGSTPCLIHFTGIYLLTLLNFYLAWRFPH